MALKLRQRGVDEDTVQAAVGRSTATANGPSPSAGAPPVALARRGSAPARARRLVGLLARKGYPPGLAHEVVRDVLRAVGDDEQVLGQLSAD